MKATIRIHQISMKQIKNVTKGVVTFQDGNLVSSQGAGILGIFGQNGSGKTAVLDSLLLFKTLVSGETLDSFSSYLINLETKECEVEIVLHVTSEEVTYLVTYQFKLSLSTRNRLRISEEKLSYLDARKDLRKHVILKSEGLLDHNVVTKGAFSLPLERPSNLNRSLLFSKKIISQVKDQLSPLELHLIQLLQEYASDHVLIINNFSNRDFRTKDEFPLIYYANLPGDHHQVMRLKYGLNRLKEADYQLFRVIVSKISQLLDKIIPGIALSYRHSTKDGLHIVELVTVREGSKLPLKYESIGVKKLVLVLGALISMYNAPDVMVAIDEIDAGIFEYLLGEIFVILKEEGLGQLLFTSHNLRPLEILNPYQVIFTSNNPSNRYVSLSKKPHTNLRDLYLRSIELGGQKHPIYQSTDQYEISRAFRLAGQDE